MRVGFIGTGNMGFPMAQNLLLQGNELIVHNRTKEKAEPLIARGAKWAESPAEVAEKSEVLFTMLSDDHALEEVTLGQNGLLSAMHAGSIHVSSSTVSVQLMERLTKLHQEKGVFLLSSPVMGRPDAAKAARLKLLLAGPAEVIEQVKPLLQALGEVLICGEVPKMANAVKLGNNFLIASMLEALAEAITMVRKHGVKAEDYVEIMNAFFGSPVYKNYSHLMLNRAWEPAGFKLQLGLKDVKLALAAAEAVHAPMPVADVVKNHLIEAMAQGWGDQDWTAILKAVERDAGVDRE